MNFIHALATIEPTLEKFRKKNEELEKMCIRDRLPTANLPSELDADHRIVYERVAGRRLETFSGACVKENTSLTLQSAGHDFTARGSIRVETGWRAVLNEPVEEKEEDMTLLPDIVQGHELPVKGCGTQQKQTRPRPLPERKRMFLWMFGYR